MNSKRQKLPVPLEGVRRRFEHWRRSRTPGTRIPDSLWQAAAKMARSSGVNRTAKALGLDYYSYSLKERAEAPSAEDGSLIEHYHYLGYTQPVGEQLKYLVFVEDRPIACLAWSSAPRHLGCRDRFIGWSAKARRENIRFLAYNLRCERALKKAILHRKNSLFYKTCNGTPKKSLATRRTGCPGTTSWRSPHPPFGNLRQLTSQIAVRRPRPQRASLLPQH